MIATIGKVIIVTAVVTSVICVIQTGADTMFMRVGEQRSAFGDVLRATGILKPNASTPIF